MDDAPPLHVGTDHTTGRGSVRRRWCCCCALLVVLAVLLVNPFTLLFASIMLQQRGIAQDEAKLRTPAVHQPVARRLAQYCDSGLIDARWIDGGWIPPEVRRIAPNAWGSVSPGGAALELGGGFYHYGYFLTCDVAASTSEVSVWHLSLHREQQPDEPLCTVRLAAADRLTREELRALVIAEHDEVIAGSPLDPGTYQRKIQAHLALDDVAGARRACADMAARLPDDWWANLVHALVLAETDPAAGERSMRAFVARTPSFFAWLDLAYYFQLRGQPDEAARAASEATRHDAGTSWGHGGNSEHRGYTAAKYAYDSGHDDVAIELCDHLLPVTINGDYAKAALRQLRAAAARAAAGGPRERVGWPGVSPFDPFESANKADASVDIEALLGRPLARPTYEDTRR